MRLALALSLLLYCLTAQAQWQLQESHTTADLRGIHSLPNGVAWASGTDGTVLHTEDSGQRWQLCAVPPGAEHLDFRGIQAFDRNTAIVMSSGKGDLSRLYKTTDSCKTWKLVFTNPDREGFWDSLRATDLSRFRTDGKFWIQAELIGDPVDGVFAEFSSSDGEEWTRVERAWATPSLPGESLFAASNSALVKDSGGSLFVTGGKAVRSRVEREYVKHDPRVSVKFVGGNLPFPSNDSSGAFSVASSHIDPVTPPKPQGDPKDYLVYFADMTATYVAVGGDYKKPQDARHVSTWSKDGGLHWKLSSIQPHGYRSAVAYSPTTKAWITVGPNGTDVSTDDGRNWRALKPAPTGTPDEDKNWNALSLPLVVGPHGRIGLLRPETLKP